MWQVTLKDYCLDCGEILYYKFPYIKQFRLSTKLWCKNCNKVTTYFEQDFRLIYIKALRDLSNNFHNLPVGKEKLRKEYCHVQKLYLNIGGGKHQEKLDNLRKEIFK